MRPLHRQERRFAQITTSVYCFAPPDILASLPPRPRLTAPAPRKETAVETMAKDLPLTPSAAPMRARSALEERLRQNLERDFPGGPPPGVDLGAIARDAIAELEGARVRAFVPLLALRAAREALAKTTA